MRHYRHRAARVVVAVFLVGLVFAPDHLLAVVSVLLSVLGDRVSRYFR